MAKKVAFIQGNEAAAHGALYAGCKFFAGYPITPSTEVAEVMSAELPKIGGKFIQMEDEIGAMAAIIGASLTGAKVLTSTSGPGLSLKQETDRLCLHCRDSLRHLQRHARRAFHRYADRPEPVRRHVRQVGHPR